MDPRFAALESGGALLIDKPEGVSSFGLIDQLQRALATAHGVKRKDLPKMGHGGTLDPFATGLLVVAVGRGVKLARYFLGSDKIYEGLIRFGETTIPGDPTDPVSERTGRLPENIEAIRRAASARVGVDYLQTPPMHSAKKRDGKPLYELARQGIEVEREPKLCRLHSFEIPEYLEPRASFRVHCTSGTYIRVLAQDLGRDLGTVAMLDALRRTRSGRFDLAHAMTLAEIEEATLTGKLWSELRAWTSFDRLLDDYPRVEVTEAEAQALIHGKQAALPAIVSRCPDSATDCIAIYCSTRLTAVARRENGLWGIERVFP